MVPCNGCHGQSPQEGPDVPTISQMLTPWPIATVSGRPGQNNIRKILWCKVQHRGTTTSFTLVGVEDKATTAEKLKTPKNKILSTMRNVFGSKTPIVSPVPLMFSRATRVFKLSDRIPHNKRSPQCQRFARPAHDLQGRTGLRAV